MRWGLRTKILISMGLVIFAVLGISTLVHIRYSKRDYLEAVEWRAESLAQSISAEIVKWAGGAQTQNIKAALKGSAFQSRQLYELNKDKQVTHVAIIDESGNIVVHNDRDLQDTQITSERLLAQLRRRELTTIADGNSYHTLIPIFRAEQMYLGTIDIGHDQRLVDLKIQQILRRSGLLFGFFLILAIFPVSIFVQAFNINPVTTLTRIINVAEQLGAASDNLTQISSQMAAGAKQTAQQVQIVSSNSQHISQSVHDVSVATEEVTANIHEISHNIQDVSQNISSAVDISNTANTTLTNLTAHSEEIGHIIKLITDITQQTNLLALNATIEAARAGDSGRGFAVVANEVRDLAHETAASAEDITHKVETIQFSSQEATKAMNAVTDITKRVELLSTTIASAISEQSHVIQEVSLRIAETAEGSHEITQTIEEIAADAQGSSARAARVQEGAQILSELADQLRQLVEDFQR